MRHTLLLLSLLAALSSMAALPRELERIKSDSRYYWAIGKGSSVTAASQDALDQILSRLPWAGVTSEVRGHDHTTVRNGRTTDTEQTYESFMSVFTYAYLEHCEEYVIDDGSHNRRGDCEVMRWVAKKDVDNMDRRLNERIIEYIDNGRRAERRLQIDDALRYYYWAYLLRAASCRPISYDFGQGPKDVITLMPDKVKNIMSDLQARLVSCRKVGNRWFADVEFMYHGQLVSTLQIKYKDGNAMRPEIFDIQDGHAEIELTEPPYRNQLVVQYVYRFNDEADNDPALRTAYRAVTPLRVNNEVIIPVKVSRSGEVSPAKKLMRYTPEVDITPQYRIDPEAPLEMKKRIDYTHLVNIDSCDRAMRAIINALDTDTPRLARQYFTDEAYDLFVRMCDMAKVQLVGGKDQTLEYVMADDRVLARFVKVKLKYKKRTFEHKLVFRFNPYTRLIDSWAFGLTDLAESCLMTSSFNWPEQSRWEILKFMEDYQTAFDLKRLDYIKLIFSENALIYTGTMLPSKSTASRGTDGSFGSLNVGNSDQVRYDKYTKAQYIRHLEKVFDRNSYINISFEDNVSRLLPNAPRVKGSVFAIEIRQIYTSTSYSDTGYLTLIINTETELPIIGVRIWQPDSRNLVGLEEFIAALKF